MSISTCKFKEASEAVAVETAANLRQQRDDAQADILASATAAKHADLETQKQKQCDDAQADILASATAAKHADLETQKANA